ncbi:hypothetical protein Daus18300_008224 [Diaporthe australafricana]|uniref:ZZ-type domain-containing protein n=1 Tax=Diaporthe australafricana TaxID=127596 RepID=A0ABR3WIV9_9PEZI
MNASISIWKLGDFFCLEGLCKLALDGRAQRLREISFSVRSEVKPASREQLSIIIHMVRGVYEGGTNVRNVFGPPLIAFLLDNVRSVAKTEAFENLLLDLPEFASEWAITLTNTVSSITKRDNPFFVNKCAKCNELSTGRTNRLKWFKERKVERLCEECFSIPPVEDWINGSSNKGT